MAKIKSGRQSGSGRTKDTPQLREKFLIRLAENDGHVVQSCKDIAISKSQAYRWKAKHEEFGDEWDEIVDFALEQLEVEARRRAVKGVNVPVFYQGQICGEKTEYSDKLLEILETQ